MKLSAIALLPLGVAAAAFAQGVTPKTTPAKPAAAVPAAQAPAAPGADITPPAYLPPKGGTELQLRGLDKITGRPTNITAPVGKTVRFATLNITVRFCYSTPQTETPETTAFVQIEDKRPDQPAHRVFSGWMYGSSPGLNGVEHPLYDVWVIACNNAPAQAVASNNSTAPTKVKAPDSSDKEGIEALPEGAGQ